MGLSNTHPSYDAQIQNWQFVRDFNAGESAVKAKGELYLPIPDSIQADKENNDLKRFRRRYHAYKERAVVPMHVRRKVNLNVGLMHSKPPLIKLPPEMEYLRDSATVTGESLEMLLRRINACQILTGRLGLLDDFRVSDNKFYIALYEAEAIRNWDSTVTIQGTTGSLNLVVLDESGPVREGFAWQNKTQYKVLMLGKFDENEQEATYKAGTFYSDQFDEATMKEVSLLGKTLKEIPFVFINHSDLSPEPTDPITLDLAKTCRTIYRGEADYRQSLYMQGQDTLVVIGGIRNKGTEDDPIRTGAGALIEVNDTGDAKYIGVDSAGLPEQRQALDADRDIAQAESGQFISSMQGSQRESGVSLSTRLAAQTSDLNQIAVTGAEGLQKALRFIAKWMGLDETLVEVTPNTEFVRSTFSGDDLVKLTSSINEGLPLSHKSVHDILQDNHFTQMTYEEEVQAIKSEIEAGLRVDVVTPPEPVNQQPINNS